MVEEAWKTPGRYGSLITDGELAAQDVNLRIFLLGYLFDNEDELICQFGILDCLHHFPRHKSSVCKLDVDILLLVKHSVGGLCYSPK